MPARRAVALPREAGHVFPERRRENVLTAAAFLGAHVFGSADDWEVSGATDPMTRPKLGPWLFGAKKLLVTYRLDGPWELDDPADENHFTVEAWGAQMELRAIRRRNRDATIKTRAPGRPKGKPSYGFQYVRKVIGSRIDQVKLHPHAAEAIRQVARGVVADPAGVRRRLDLRDGVRPGKRHLRARRRDAGQPRTTARRS
ncbi:hypothetical protein [Streptomyces sp. NBC_01217]|uniref:hypothetical protein n=1 Tax=Streptomyces sp. NBC_01217 TaxID=2903779 RepID=UPI002E12C889|nr:hypothetical protein OG507_05355 [Streptomyces sp. NBC_01217]